MADVVGRKHWVLYYDGECGFCTRSVWALAFADFFRVVAWTDFRKLPNPPVGLTWADLDAAAYLEVMSGRYWRGFWARTKALPGILCVPYADAAAAAVDAAGPFAVAAGGESAGGMGLRVDCGQPLPHKPPVPVESEEIAWLMQLKLPASITPVRWRGRVCYWFEVPAFAGTTV